MLKHKSNPHLVETVGRLRKAGSDTEAPVWRAVAKQLEKPSRVWPEVNVGQISRVAVDGKTVVVAGKVLGGGFIDKGVTVAAWAFSESAKKKIADAGGKCLTLDELLAAKPTAATLQVVA